MTKLHWQSIGMGLFLWFIFIFIIRLAGDTFFATGTTNLLVVFIVTIPAVLIMIPLVSRVLGVSLHQMTVPIALISFTALLCDGIAVGFTDIYGSTPDQIAAAASFLLWGVGISLIGALWFERRGATT